METGVVLVIAYKDCLKTGMGSESVDDVFWIGFLIWVCRVGGVIVMVCGKTRRILCTNLLRKEWLLHGYNSPARYVTL